MRHSTLESFMRSDKAYNNCGNHRTQLIFASTWTVSRNGQKSYSKMYASQHHPPCPLSPYQMLTVVEI